MKKQYLLVSAFAMAAGLSAQGVKAPSTGTMLVDENATVQNAYFDILTGSAMGAKKSVSSRAANYSNFIRIGSTYYDLQTNYAMPHRLVVHPNGAVSATWTTSPSDMSGFPTRGCAYNYKGLDNKWLTSDSNCVETVRTGWANIGILRDGSEFTIGHDAANGGFYITKNTTPGSRPTISTAVLQEPPYKPIWGRMANDGDTIHMVYSYTDSAAAGEKRAPTRKGIFAPMVYSRSVNGGTVWDIQHIMLPDYDSTLTNNGGADQYSIDVKGKTVAIVNADKFQGVILWKSTDAGATFERIIADTFKYTPYTSKQLMLDTPYTNDGSCDVLIDNDGDIHVFWGLARVGDRDTTDEFFTDYFGVQGIGYWSEKTATSKLIASALPFDRDGDGVIQLQSATFYGLQSGQLPTVNGSKLATCARLGNTNPMRQPNAAVDENGNIYCVFSVPIEGDVSELGANFRDIGIVHTTNDGATWSQPQNITQVLTREDDFATVARKANGFLHVMWQQDMEPGTNLQNNSTADQNHPVVLNEMYYQAIPVSSILNNEIGMVWGLKTEQPNTGNLFVVNQNYPNPFSGTTNVLIYLTQPGDVKLEVRNMAGAVVLATDFNGLFKGNHVLTIDGENLPAGVYTYSLTSGGSTVSNTMMVK
jgi:hypothetical protein